MNIGKDLNLSQIRKLLRDFYTGAYSFLIFIGIIFLVLTTVFFVLSHRRSNEYRMVYKNIEDLSSTLERYAVKKDLYNKKWVVTEEMETTLYNKEIEKCKSFFKAKDDKLEGGFWIEDPLKGLIKVEDEALWKKEYFKRISGLLKKLKANNIAIGEDALPVGEWGADIPSREAILPVQKRFWILEALVNIAVNDSGVAKFEKIAFWESSQTYDPSFEQIYTAIPVMLNVKLKADHIKCLLHKILKSDIPFVIETVNISVGGPSNISSKDKDALIGGDNLSNPVIDVNIDMYVIDYKTLN